MLIIAILNSILFAIIGIAVGYLGSILYGMIRLQSAKEYAKKILESAKREVESIKREALLEAKEEALKVKNELERENRERRADIQRLEKRLLQKEES